MKKLTLITLISLFPILSVAQTGIASFYHNKFHGRTMANGDKFNNNKLTAAHKTLPFGTIIKVTNINTKQFVYVTITDRGNFYKYGRIIDLSKEAAERIGITNKNGLAKVNIKIQTII